MLDFTFCEIFNRKVKIIYFAFTRITNPLTIAYNLAKNTR